VQLTQDLVDLKAEVDAFIALGDLKQVDDRLATVLDFEARLTQMRAMSELYNAREAIFLLPLTESPQVRTPRCSSVRASSLAAWAPWELLGPT